MEIIKNDPIIVDVFLFSSLDELTILKAKLIEEQKFINYFVVVENSYNLKGYPKQTHENVIRNEFMSLNLSNRFHYIDLNEVWDTLSNAEYLTESIPFKREASQRGVGINYALTELHADFVFVTDSDEIIKESIKTVFNFLSNYDFIHIPHITYTFNLRTINERFRFSTVINASKINRKLSQLELGALRQKKDANYLISPVKYIEHYTNQLSPDKIFTKINAFAHHSTYTHEDIEHAIEYGHELCNSKDLSSKISDTFFWNRQASAQELNDRCDAISKLDNDSNTPNYIENRKKLGLAVANVNYLHLGASVKSKIKRFYARKDK